MTAGLFASGAAQGQPLRKPRRTVWGVARGRNSALWKMELGLQLKGPVLAGLEAAAVAGAGEGTAV